MSLLVHCSHCRQTLDVAHLTPHSTVQCPYCHGVFPVPDFAHPGAAGAEPGLPLPTLRPRRSLHRRKSVLAPLLVCIVGVIVSAGVGAAIVLQEPSPALSDRSLSPSRQVAPGPSQSIQKRNTNPADAAGAPSTRRPQEPTPAAPQSALDQPPLSQATEDATVPMKETPPTENDPVPGETPSPESQMISAADSLHDMGRPQSYSIERPQPSPEAESEKTRLNLQERQRLILENRIRKKVQSLFHKHHREKTAAPGLPQENDTFVVAMYEMPLATQVADLRFELSPGLDGSIDKVTEYLLSTPSTTVRDFQVVARFATPEEAETGIAIARRRYDEAKQYQEQLLAYLQTQQQFRARALRRC